MDWVEEWKKRDPYFLDMEGYLKFIEQKEKEQRIQIQVWLDKGYSGGYQIYLTVPIEAIPEAYKNTDILQKAEEIEKTADKIREFFSPNMDRRASNKLDLKPGATTIFRNKDGKWCYYGDYSHIPREDIDGNAKILWKIWKTVGSHFPNVWGVSKDYQCDSGSVYLRYDAETEKPKFPGLGTYEMSLERTIGEAERWKKPIKPLETEEPEDPIWEEMSVLAHALMVEAIPNLDDPYEDDYVWITEDDLSVYLIRKNTIPEVTEYLAKGTQMWVPQSDYDFMRNINLFHPFLREDRTFVWTEEDVEWDAEASHMRDLYYKQFSREELEAMKVNELKDVCKAKNLNVKHRKYDMVDAILEVSI